MLLKGATQYIAEPSGRVTIAVAGPAWTARAGSGGGVSKASLHSKIFIMDGRIVSIGSMNLDLRSKLQNTEIALVIRSRRLSAQAAREIEEALASSAWRIELTDGGELFWRAPAGAPFSDARSEPDASLGLRLMLGILGPLAPDEML